MPENIKSERNKAIKKVNQLISDGQKKSVQFKFKGWIPKGSDYKTPIRFYVLNSKVQEYIFKHKNKLVISSPDKNRQLLIENFLFEHDIDISSMSSLGEMNELLETKGLLIQSREKIMPPEKQSSLRDKTDLSNMKKGDRLHIQHNDEKLVITITHIESKKGIGYLNLSCSGSESFTITTEKHGKSVRKRTSKLLGSHKGRGWSRRSQSIKK